MTTTYTAPAVMTRGDVTRNTLGKGAQSTEINLQRVSSGSHLSFGL
jgi:hypothetical protein